MAGMSRTQARQTASADLPSFYACVYRLVAHIPPGRVATYGQIARLLGHPSAARAVGYALHALPSGSDIPWQRVINAAGRISSRCDPHAESIQRTLLEAEGVRFDATGTVHLRLYRWPGPSAHDGRRDDDTNKHQEAHQHQDNGDIAPQGTGGQTTRDHRAQLPTDDDARPGEQHRSQQRQALLTEGRQKRRIQAHQRRRPGRHQDHHHG